MANKIVDACDKVYDANCANCSGFVRAVATELGVTLEGAANDIVDAIQTDPWAKLDSRTDANTKASLGWLVVGGLSATPNGHVVIVVPGSVGDDYPRAYWGHLDNCTKAGKNQTINWAWAPGDRDKVIFGYYKTKLLG